MTKFRKRPVNRNIIKYNWDYASFPEELETTPALLKSARYARGPIQNWYCDSLLKNPRESQTEDFDIGYFRFVQNIASHRHKNPNNFVHSNKYAMEI
jgi:hypothetical protein